MAFRDEDEAARAKLESLARRAAAADELEARVRQLEDENRALRQRLERYERAPAEHPPVAASDRRWIPSLPAVDGLADAIASERWSEAAELLDAHAREADTMEEVLAALVHVALIAEEHLADMGAAVRAYERAIELDPMLPGPLTELARLAGRIEDHVLALRCHLQLADITSEPSERAARLMAASSIAEERLADLETALDHARMALLINPDHAAARAAVARLDPSR